MNKVLLNAWVALIKEAGISYKDVLDFFKDRRCPVCGSHTPDLQQASVTYPCPENEKHGFLEFRKNQEDFFCHHCRQSLWEWKEGAKYCPQCELPLEIIPLMDAAKKLLPRFPEPVPSSNGAGPHPVQRRGILGTVRTKLGL